MKHKISRQRILARFSGLLLVALAFFTGGLVVSAYSFVIAFSFLFLSDIVMRQQKRISNLLLKMESDMKNDTASDRPKIEMKRQYMDIFWFYLAFGFILAFVPFNFAYIICIAISIVGMVLEIMGIGSRRK
jgi:hypothetical protein